jgi:hypothetical protein
MSPEDEDAAAGIISKLVGDGTLTQLTAEKAGGPQRGALR